MGVAQTCVSAARHPPSNTSGRRRLYRKRAAANCAYSRRRRRLPTVTASDDAAITPEQQHRPAAVLVLPGFLTSSKQYEPSMVPALRDLGYAAEVVPMSVADWLPVVRGGSFEWYLNRADELLQQLYERHGPVAIVGHSAGGWLARLLLGSIPYQGALYGRAPMAASLVTLGSPHGSIEQYPFGRAAESLQGGPELAAVPPAARTSSLQFANHYYPSSSAFPGLRLTCVCGDAVVGRPLRLPWRSYSGASSSGSSGGGDGSGGNATDDRSISVDVSTSSGGSRGSDKLTALDYWFCYESYKSGCGRGDVPGDGVTPLKIAFLPGADRLVLPGVWHAPPRGRLSRRWYGDPGVVALWERCLWACGEAAQHGQEQRRQRPAASTGSSGAGG